MKEQYRIWEEYKTLPGANEFRDDGYLTDAMGWVITYPNLSDAQNAKKGLATARYNLGSFEECRPNYTVVSQFSCGGVRKW